MKDVSELVIRDMDTGKVRVFQPTKEGYAEAQAEKEAIEQQGHRVGDDKSGTLGKLKVLHP